MAKVIGIGGVFFKASDPEQLYSWYEKHLGLEPGVLFPRPSGRISRSRPVRVF